MIKFILIITFLLFILITQCKVFKQQYSFSNLRRNKGWTFLDRMMLGQGHAEIRFNTKLILKQGESNKQFVLELAIVPDTLWPAETMLKCQRNSQSVIDGNNNNSNINNINNNHISSSQIKQTILTTHLSPSNSYQFSFFNTIPIASSQTYHFILRDCQKQLLNQYFSRDSRILVQLQIKNNGKDYGEDEKNNFFYFPLLIIGTVLMLKYIEKATKSQNSFDSKDTDYVKVLIVTSFKYMGYLIYYFAGLEYDFFDFMYLLFHSIGDSVIVTILLFVAFGWTITFINGKDFDLYVPLLCMMGLINVILTLLNKITDGSHDKYHMYDTIPAYLLVFFKAVAIIIFIIGCIRTYLQTSKQPLVQRFMIQILILGTFYIGSIPIIMLLIEYLPPSYRKQWVFILIQLGKNFICLLLTYMVSYKKSGYRTISYGERSFMEKGGRFL